ncbi:MAG TPA: hypothetical protein VEG37_07075 [Burkholderiales bacterium]|nr:hypothetical protein [Burkholderiales bacterium]
MKFLDELKKEAETLKEKEAFDTQAKLTTLGQNFMQLQAKLRAIYGYLDDLVKQLNVVKPTVLRSYYIEGVGNLSNLSQQDYFLNKRHKSIDNKDFIDEISLRFRCGPSGALTIEKESPSTIQGLREYLWSYNIKFEAQEIKNDRGYVQRVVFKIPGEVVVNITISGDFEKSQIKFHTKNMERLTEREYVYEIDEVDDTLLEEFSKFLVNKPNNFRQLGKRQISTARMTSPKRNILDTQYPQVEEVDKKKGMLDSIKSLFTERR